MDNMTLKLDEETRDLVFDSDGSFQKIYEEDTIIQNVRNTLLTWKAEFFADETHGTDYERILGKNQNEIDDGEIEEVIREAIFQEPSVTRIDDLKFSYEKRAVEVTVIATLENGEKIKLEVTA
ncbi:MAG: DUF2634 domain-containing protein [Butyrivibrio sp.]|nr:DUF2634 domain-containing protein [Butyrivibrio sp.]